MAAENEILNMLARGALALNIPQPADLRGKLATNPKGTPWRKRDVSKMRGLCLHQSMGWSSVETEARYHAGEFGPTQFDPDIPPGLCYTGAVRRNGQFVLAWDFDDRTWSQGTEAVKGDENALYMAVMVEGKFKGPDVKGDGVGEPSDEQIASIMLLWRVVKSVALGARWELKGHADFGKAACPGDTLYTIIKAIRTSEPPRWDLSTVRGQQQALQAYFDNRPGSTSKGWPSVDTEGEAYWGAQCKSAAMYFQKLNKLPVTYNLDTITARVLLAKLEELGL